MSQSSDLEELFLYWLHLLCPDMPEPQRQAELIPNRKHQIDFFWPSTFNTSGPDAGHVYPGLVVEIDGLAKQAGGGKHMTPQDYEKINLLNLQGYCVLRFLGSQIRNDPVYVINQVAQAQGRKVREL